MRFVAWNCCQGPLDCKLEMLRTLEADVAVVCECPSLLNVDDYASVWTGRRRPQGVGVLTRGGYAVRAAEILSPFAIAAEVSGPIPFRLLALWAHRRPNYVRDTLNHLAVYRGWLELGDSIVAGDFNSSPVFDRNGAENHGDVVSACADLNLVSAYHAYSGEAHGAEMQATYFHQRNPSKPFHIDYAFVPASWAERLTVRVAPAEGCSDHMPLVVDVRSHNGSMAVGQ